MITNKFEYPSLRRIHENGTRRYTNESKTARPVPSVTTILDATKSEESRQALANWRKRVGTAKAQAITTEAAGRGTRLHKWLEDYILTGDAGTPGTNPYSIQSHGMAQIIIDKGLSRADEYWGTEVGLMYPDVYAGTTDCVGMFEGEPAIIDFKQTNKPKKREWIDDYFAQLTAYAAAHNVTYGTDIKKGVILMCSKDNEYQEFIIEGDEYEEYEHAWATRVEEYYSKFL